MDEWIQKLICSSLNPQCLLLGAQREGVCGINEWRGVICVVFHVQTLLWEWGELIE